jgi:hypothetical protein
MAKPKVTAESFLTKMNIGAAEPTTSPAVDTVPPTPTDKPAYRVGRKHIGGYFDKDTTEKVAILRARLSLDNSELIKLAIEELYRRETAARKFGES